MEQDLRTYLLILAESYALARGLSDATLGNLAAGDWQFFARLRAGRTFTVRKYDAVVAWFRANWPDSAGWPEPVPKLSVSPTVGFAATSPKGEEGDKPIRQ